MLELIEAEHGSMVLTVPTILLAMLGELRPQPRDVSSLRTVMSGGAKVPDTLVRRTTETFSGGFTIRSARPSCTACSARRRRRTARRTRRRPGPAMPHVEVKIADLATGEPVGVGEEGEICARGYQNMVGYWDMPDATAATIDTEGWLHTGDAGTMDGRGYLRIAGRLKDIIIRGGENIHAARDRAAAGGSPRGGRGRGHRGAGPALG